MVEVYCEGRVRVGVEWRMCGFALVRGLCVGWVVLVVV